MGDTTEDKPVFDVRRGEPVIHGSFYPEGHRHCAYMPAFPEAQQRYAAGVADNLAVSQAQTSMAQADDQLVSSLYQHNVAKLFLARALGIAQTNYKDYVGGK